MHELDLRKFDSAPSVALFMLEDVWVGALVPKRWAKRAVTRNAIKRQIYNVSAESAAVFDVAGYVIRLRAAFDRTRFISATSETLKSAVRLELQQLFAVLGQRSVVREPDVGCA